ncbi:MAG: LysR family transcriptional regulator [Thalassotalea sp.]
MHSWDDFRYFLAVANCGSFSEAAKQLKVNHSTVSRRIQALESKHGVRLFDRTLNGYKMTDAGAAIYEIAEQLQESTLKASRILQGQDARLEGDINLTMPHEIFDYILSKPLNDFYQLHPNIYFNLMVSKGLRNMANMEADLAVRITGSPPDYLIGTRVTKMQHGLYQARSLVVKDYTPIVVWAVEQEVPRWAFEYFDNPKVVLHVDDLHSMYRAVKAGFGIARMPCFMPDRVAEQDVVRLPIDLPMSDWGIWLLNHVDLRNTARINAARAFIKTELEKQLPLFQGKLSNYG